MKRKLGFQAKHVSGVDRSLADLITRCEPSKINAELKRRRPDVNWRKQVVGGEEEKCSAILRGDTRSDAVGKVERVERGNLLVRGNGVQARGSGRAGGV